MKIKWKAKWFKIRSPSRKKTNIYLGVFLAAAIFSLLMLVAADKIFDGFGRGAHEPAGKEYSIDAQPPVPAATSVKLPVKKEVLVAIILDDAAADSVGLDAALAIRSPLTISILPAGANSADLSGRVRASGKEVMLHLPMEPAAESYVSRNGDMVLVDMSDEAIKELVGKSLAHVPGASGVNNHMGSRATQDKRVMKAVLEVIKEAGLYFVDSRTSRVSLAGRTARELGVKSSENNVFLDSEVSEEYTERMLEVLVARARAFGRAIGIGHVTRRSTVDVLSRKMPEYENNGVRFVFASELVE